MAVLATVLAVDATGGPRASTAPVRLDTFVPDGIPGVVGVGLTTAPAALIPDELSDTPNAMGEVSFLVTPTSESKVAAPGDRGVFYRVVWAQGEYIEFEAPDVPFRIELRPDAEAPTEVGAAQIYTTLARTLVAGSNVTITADPAAQTLTVSSTGGGGAGDRVPPYAGTDQRILKSSRGTAEWLPENFGADQSAALTTIQRLVWGVDLDADPEDGTLEDRVEVLGHLRDIRRVSTNTVENLTTTLTDQAGMDRPLWVVVTADIGAPHNVAAGDVLYVPPRASVFLRLFNIPPAGSGPDPGPAFDPTPILDRLTAIEADGWVTQGRIAFPAIIGRHINARVVAGGHLVDNFLEGRHVPNDLITDRMIPANQIGQSELKGSSVGTDELIDANVTENKLSEAVRNKLTPPTIFDALLAAGMLTLPHLGTAAVLQPTTIGWGLVGGLLVLHPQIDPFQVSVSVNTSTSAVTMLVGKTAAATVDDLASLSGDAAITVGGTTYRQFISTGDWTGDPADTSPWQAPIPVDALADGLAAALTAALGREDSISIDFSSVRATANAAEGVSIDAVRSEFLPWIDIEPGRYVRGGGVQDLHLVIGGVPATGYPNTDGIDIVARGILLHREAWTPAAGNRVIDWQIDATEAANLDRNIGANQDSVLVELHFTERGVRTLQVSRELPIGVGRRVLQAAVAGSDSAGTVSITLPADYADYHHLSLGIWEGGQDAIAVEDIPVPVLTANAAANIRDQTSARQNLVLRWNRGARTLSTSSPDRIIYAALEA